MGASPWETRIKTPAEIDREFGVEKWGRLLKRAHNHPGAADLETVNGWVSENAVTSLVSVGDELVEMTPRESHSAYIDFIARSLAPYLQATALFELGCGYGTVILDLARRADFTGMRLFAADYTAAGAALASLIAKAENISVATGRCDFTKRPLTALEIPEGSLVYTAYATQYVESLGRAFIEGIAALRPGAVVHVEPVLEHCNLASVLGLLRRRYIEANGYNRNLVTLLHEEAARGRIRLLEETLPAFGPNPLLAASVIAWVPVADFDQAANRAGGSGDPV